VTGHLHRLDPAGCAPETTRPEPGKVISGDPVHTSWNIEERDGLFCGLWESTPGAWRVDYTEWEYCRILSGLSVLTEDGAAPVTVRAGDSFVIRPGFGGIWEVVETTRKDYVIRV
jgi:uncharacterized cupin superfamily protein